MNDSMVIGIEKNIISTISDIVRTQKPFHENLSNSVPYSAPRGLSHFLLDDHTENASRIKRIHEDMEFLGLIKSIDHILYGNRSSSELSQRNGGVKHTRALLGGRKSEHDTRSGTSPHKHVSACSEYSWVLVDLVDSRKSIIGNFPEDLISARISRSGCRAHFLEANSKSVVPRMRHHSLSLNYNDSQSYKRRCVCQFDLLLVVHHGIGEELLIYACPCTNEDDNITTRSKSPLKILEDDLADDFGLDAVSVNQLVIKDALIAFRIVLRGFTSAVSCVSDTHDPSIFIGLDNGQIYRIELGEETSQIQETINREQDGFPDSKRIRIYNETNQVHAEISSVDDTANVRILPVHKPFSSHGIGRLVSPVTSFVTGKQLSVISLIVDRDRMLLYALYGPDQTIGRLARLFSLIGFNILSEVNQNLIECLSTHPRFDGHFADNGGSLLNDAIPSGGEFSSPGKSHPIRTHSSLVSTPGLKMIHCISPLPFWPDETVDVSFAIVLKGGLVIFFYMELGDSTTIPAWTFRQSEKVSSDSSVFDSSQGDGSSRGSLVQYDIKVLAVKSSPHPNITVSVVDSLISKTSRFILFSDNTLYASSIININDRVVDSLYGVCLKSPGRDDFQRLKFTGRDRVQISNLTSSHTLLQRDSIQMIQSLLISEDIKAIKKINRTYSPTQTSRFLWEIIFFGIIRYIHLEPAKTKKKSVSLADVMATGGKSGLSGSNSTNRSRSRDDLFNGSAHVECRNFDSWSQLMFCEVTDEHNFFSVHSDPRILRGASDLLFNSDVSQSLGFVDHLEIEGMSGMTVRMRGIMTIVAEVLEPVWNKKILTISKSEESPGEGILSSLMTSISRMSNPWSQTPRKPDCSLKGREEVKFHSLDSSDCHPITNIGGKRSRYDIPTGTLRSSGDCERIVYLTPGITHISREAVNRKLIYLIDVLESLCCATGSRDSRVGQLIFSVLPNVAKLSESERQVIQAMLNMMRTIRIGLQILEIMSHGNQSNGGNEVDLDHSYSIPIADQDKGHAKSKSDFFTFNPDTGPDSVIALIDTNFGRTFSSPDKARKIINDLLRHRVLGVESIFGCEYGRSNPDHIGIRHALPAYSSLYPLQTRSSGSNLECDWLSKVTIGESIPQLIDDKMRIFHLVLNEIIICAGCIDNIRQEADYCESATTNIKCLEAPVKNESGRNANYGLGAMVRRYKNWFVATSSDSYRKDALTDTDNDIADSRSHAHEMAQQEIHARISQVSLRIERALNALLNIPIEHLEDQTLTSSLCEQLLANLQKCFSVKGMIMVCLWHYFRRHIVHPEDSSIEEARDSLSEQNKSSIMKVGLGIERKGEKWYYSHAPKTPGSAKHPYSKESAKNQKKSFEFLANTLNFVALVIESWDEINSTTLQGNTTETDPRSMSSARKILTDYPGHSLLLNEHLKNLHSIVLRPSEMVKFGATSLHFFLALILCFQLPIVDVWYAEKREALHKYVLDFVWTHRKSTNTIIYNLAFGEDEIFVRVMSSSPFLENWIESNESRVYGMLITGDAEDSVANHSTKAFSDTNEEFQPHNYVRQSLLPVFLKVQKDWPRLIQFYTSFSKSKYKIPISARLQSIGKAQDTIKYVIDSEGGRGRGVLRRIETEVQELSILFSLQEKTLKQLIEQEVNEDEIQEMKFRQMNVNELYNDFVIRYQLWELAIEFRYTCESSSPRSVRKLFDALAIDWGEKEIKVDEAVARICKKYKNAPKQFRPIDLYCQLVGIARVHKCLIIDGCLEFEEVLDVMLSKSNSPQEFEAIESLMVEWIQSSKNVSSLAITAKRFIEALYTKSSGRYGRVVTNFLERAEHFTG